jgi:hypothetical protein
MNANQLIGVTRLIGTHEVSDITTRDDGWVEVRTGEFMCVLAALEDQKEHALWYRLTKGRDSVLSFIAELWGVDEDGQRTWALHGDARVGDEEIARLTGGKCQMRDT